LRDYGTDPLDWPEVSYSPMRDLPEIDIPAQSAKLGLEEDVWSYVGHLVSIFREVRRVLRKDGTLWLNLGDCYATSGRGRNVSESSPTFHGAAHSAQTRRKIPEGFRSKDMVGVPWRVAFALQADGWYLRSDVIWAKGISFCKTYSGSTMPESIRDRPSKSHEYVFLFGHPDSKGLYFFDQHVLRERSEDVFHGSSRPRPGIDVHGGNQGEGITNVPTVSSGRNVRSVWAINPGSFPGAHFAVFPPRLIAPCIRAGTSEYGCCTECGAPWRRVRGPLAWETSCRCGCNKVDHPVVLDPFGGAGTTGCVADDLGRSAVLIELNRSYVEMSDDRVRRARKQINLLSLMPG